MNEFARKYAIGAITKSDDLKALVIEARKEKKAIRLYCVMQMGHVSTFYITSKSRYEKNKTETGLCAGPSFDQIKGFDDHASIGYRKTNARWFRSNILMGTFDIDGSSNYDPEHRLFTNKALAMRYSEALKNDTAYVAGVHRHWARCKELFDF